MLVIGRTVASGVSAEASNEAGQEARGGRVAPQKLAKGAGPRGYDQGRQPLRMLPASEKPARRKDDH